VTLDALFFAALLILPFFDWLATLELLRLNRLDPSVGFLTERTVAALVVSSVTTVYALVALNTQLGFPVLDRTAALDIVRSAVVILGFHPIFWLVLYRRVK
jgi:hypothetical protein